MQQTSFSASPTSCTYRLDEQNQCEPLMPAIAFHNTSQGNVSDVGAVAGLFFLPYIDMVYISDVLSSALCMSYNANGAWRVPHVYRAQYSEVTDASPNQACSNSLKRTVFAFSCVVGIKSPEQFNSDMKRSSNIWVTRTPAQRMVPTLFTYLRSPELLENPWA